MTRQARVPLAFTANIIQKLNTFASLNSLCSWSDQVLHKLHLVTGENRLNAQNLFLSAGFNFSCFKIFKLYSKQFRHFWLRSSELEVLRNLSAGFPLFYLVKIETADLRCRRVKEEALDLGSGRLSNLKGKELLLLNLSVNSFSIALRKFSIWNIKNLVKLLQSEPPREPASEPRHTANNVKV